VAFRRKQSLSRGLQKNLRGARNREMYILLQSVRRHSDNDSSKGDHHERQGGCTMKTKEIVRLMLLGLAVVLTACLRYVPHLK